MPVKAVLFDFFGVMFLPRKLGFTRKFVPNQSLLAYSQGLRPKYRVALLSNMSAGVMDKYLTRQQLNDYFDDVIISGEVDLAKPDPAMYELAAKVLNLNPAECVVVDDNLTNCRGAERAGMKAVLYKSTEQAQRELELLLK